MLNPLVGYAAAGALLVGFGAGWTIRDWRCDAAQLAAATKAAAAEHKAQEVVDDTAYAYEDERAALTQTATIERNTVREIYRDVEVPADCAADPAGRGLLASARQRANAAASGQSGAELRPAS